MVEGGVAAGELTDELRVGCPVLFCFIVEFRFLPLGITKTPRDGTAPLTPSRLATRTASSNSPSACACHLDIVTLRRLTPATGGGERGGGAGGGDGGATPPSATVLLNCRVTPLNLCSVLVSSLLNTLSLTCESWFRRCSIATTSPCKVHAAKAITHHCAPHVDPRQHHLTCTHHLSCRLLPPASSLLLPHPGPPHSTLGGVDSAPCAS